MKRSPSEVATALQALCQALTNEPFAKVWHVRRPQIQPMLELLKGPEPALAASLRERLVGLAGAESLARAPIVGVCGTLNSGKSTLVASFLSPANRRRVVIGDRMHQASQQFVFWLPESAQADKAFLATFHQQFQAQFRAAPQLLSLDPKEALLEASAAQSSEDQMKRPLLAFDPALEKHRLGFLDCPDIQRNDFGETMGEEANPRLNALIQAARFCSAFVVVASQEQFGSRTVPDLLHALTRHAPGLPLFLAVNKSMLDREDSLADVAGCLQSWDLDAVVKDAYHASSSEEVHERKSWPVFLNAKRDSIAALPSKLSGSSLGQAYLRSALSEVEASLSQGVARLRKDQARTDKEATRASAHVRKFVAQHFLEGKNKVRFLYSAGMTSQLLEALERTAPMEIRVALQIAKPIQWLNESVRDGMDSLRKRFWSGESAAPTGTLHEVPPDAFGEHIRPLASLRAGHDEQAIRQVWEQAMRALAEHNAIEKALDAKVLDPILRRLWDDVPMWQRVTLACVLPGIMLACLAAVLFLSSIDFGATAVLAASVPELLASVGLGMLANHVAMNDLTRLLEDQIGLRQLANLHAALLDGLALPREDKITLGLPGGGKARALPQPDLPEQEAKTQLLEKPVLRLVPGVVETAQERLRALEKVLLQNNLP